MLVRGVRFRVMPCAFLMLCLVQFGTAAKRDFQADLHKWTTSHLDDPQCKVRYTTGIYRPDLGNQPALGFMTENMFRWFSTEGERIAPGVCPVTRATLGQAGYLVLLSLAPMTTTSNTTHSYETKTTTEPFQANVYGSDGSSATIQGSQSSTVIVPTETTIARSSSAIYMYTYRIKSGGFELLSTDNVVFTRVAASGSGSNAAGAELGAGIGNLIRATKDKHRADKLYEEAMRSILSDSTRTANAPSVSVAANLSSTAQPFRPPSSEDVAGIRTRAEAGLAGAQFELGVTYATGQGNNKDVAEAARWFRKAAEQGYPNAQYGLGLMYASGIGVPKDEVESYFWLNLGAAGLGDEARSTRDKVGQMLTPELRLEVQKRCSDWTKEHTSPH